MTEYRQTKQQCAESIRGVCSLCGGNLEPIETVDNAGNPTFWSGCEKCFRFDTGVSPEIYHIAKKLVENHHYHHYHHIEMKESDDADIKQYKNERQIGGTCDVVRTVLALYAEIKETKNDRESE